MSEHHQPLPVAPRVERLVDAPIIGPDLDPSIGTNIQGPSLIRVPDWVPDRLGTYYLYFADHKGAYIRLAWADELTGPWTVHVPGTLQLADSHFPTVPFDPSDEDVERLRAAYLRSIEPEAMPLDLRGDISIPHIASPDVHVDDENQRIIMYFHGLEGLGHQVTRVATSSDGIHFSAAPEILGRTYLRAFTWDDQTYALAMPGQFYRSADGLTNFEEGPRLFGPRMRHNAVRVVGHHLEVFWTQVGDAPERILLSTIDLRGDWMEWRESGAVEVMRPERPWEGANQPVQPSIRSDVHDKVNELRDPCLFKEGTENNTRTYLLYAVAGESGIGLAEILDQA